MHRTVLVCGAVGRDIGFEIFKAELQLVVVESLGPLTKLVALELLHYESQSLDLCLRLGESGALGRERAHHPLQHLHIVRQSGQIDVHASRV
jgi:hypothetical protein